MANIEERKGKNGISYRITVYDSKNKKYRKTTFKPTETAPTKIKKELEAFATEYERKIQNGEYLLANELTYKEYAKIWEDEVGAQTLTPDVLNDYVSILNNRVIPLIGNMKLGNIRPADLQGMVSKWRKDGLAQPTIKKNFVVCNAVLKHAYKMEIIKDKPYEKVTIIDQKKSSIDLEDEDEFTEDIKFFDKAQAINFLECLSRELPYKVGNRKRIDKNGNIYEVKGYTAYTSTPFQWRCYFDLALCYGLRRGEIVALKWKDIDLENNHIYITKAFSKTMLLKAPKTKTSKRHFDLDTSSIELLKEWKKQQKELALQLGTLWQGKRGANFDNNYIFIQLDSGLPMNIHTPLKKFEKICKLYNDSCEDESKKLPNITLHDLRHTFATLSLSDGADLHSVSYILGHSDVSITLNVYGHYIRRNVNEVSTIVSKTLKKVINE